MEVNTFNPSKHNLVLRFDPEPPKKKKWYHMFIPQSTPSTTSAGTYAGIPLEELYRGYKQSSSTLQSRITELELIIQKKDREIDELRDQIDTANRIKEAFFKGVDNDYT